MNNDIDIDDANLVRRAVETFLFVPLNGKVVYYPYRLGRIG